MFKARLRVLTGDVGPHASRVLASLIIIFHAAAHPPTPTHCELLLKLWRLSQIWESRGFVSVI